MMSLLSCFFFFDDFTVSVRKNLNLNYREGGWIQREIRASGASRGKSIMNGSSPGVTIAFSSDEDEEAGPNVFVPSRERQIVGEKRDNKPKVSAPPAVRHVSAAIKTSAENRDCRSGDDYGSEEEQEKYYEYQIICFLMPTS